MIIRKATTIKEFEAVWRLTHDQYVTEGYVKQQLGGMLKHYAHLDLIPETTVLLAEDDDGRLMGSNSYTVDGSVGLHVDDDFKDATDLIREECRSRGLRLGASWRIVTEPRCRREHLLATVMQLISATLEGGRHLADVVLFTFNPKHESFYSCMLGLQTIAGPRAARSLVTPDILMRGNMSEMLLRWQRVVARRSSARLVPAAH